MKGGARQGAGRPKAAPTTVVRIRLTAEQHAAWEALGAHVWLKRVLGEEVLGKTPIHATKE